MCVLALSGFENKIAYLRGGNTVGFDSSQVTLVYVFRYSACQVKVQVDHWPRWLCYWNGRTAIWPSLVTYPFIFFLTMWRGMWLCECVICFGAQGRHKFDLNSRLLIFKTLTIFPNYISSHLINILKCIFLLLLVQQESWHMPCGSWLQWCHRAS